MKITRNLSNLFVSQIFNKKSNNKNEALMMKCLINRNVYHSHNINSKALNNNNKIFLDDNDNKVQLWSI